MGKYILIVILGLLPFGLTGCVPFEGAVYEDEGPFFGDYGFWDDGGDHHHEHHH